MDSQVQARQWRGIALRGIVAILLGIVSIVLPGAAFMSLVIAFGVYAIVDGGITLVAAARAPAPGRGAAIFSGLISMVVGVLALAWPGITAFVLIMLIASWSMVAGIFEIAAAIQLRKEITGEWLLALQGVLSIAFGTALVIAPFVGAIVIGLWIGSYALVIGGLLIALAFRLRKRLGAGPGPALAGA
jgi:uncharacterized membrane protein HdeD (DUF308 family)